MKNEDDETEILLCSINKAIASTPLFFLALLISMQSLFYPLFQTSFGFLIRRNRGVNLTSSETYVFPRRWQDALPYGPVPDPVRTS